MKITCAQIDEAYKALKQNRFIKITDRLLTQKLLSQFLIDDVHYDLVYKGVKVYSYNRDKICISKNSYGEGEFFKVYVDIGNPEKDYVNSNSEKETTPNYRLSLLEVNIYQQYRRTAPIISFIKDKADLNKVSVNKLMGIIIKQINYKHDRNSSDIGDKLLQGTEYRVLPKVKASYLLQNLQLGRFGYRILKKTLTDEGNQERNTINFPSWRSLRDFQYNLMPPILHDTQLPGVRFEYLSAIKMTIKRVLDSNVKIPISKDLTVLIKDGVDGSGSHAIYHQLNNVQTHNMLMYMFCVLRITESVSGKIVYEERLSASPFAMRPVFLIHAKEECENLET